MRQGFCDSHTGLHHAMDPPGDYQRPVIVPPHMSFISRATQTLRPALGPGSLLGSWRASSQAADAPIRPHAGRPRPDTYHPLSILLARCRVPCASAQGMPTTMCCNHPPPLHCLASHRSSQRAPLSAATPAKASGAVRPPVAGSVQRLLAPQHSRPFDLRARCCQRDPLQKPCSQKMLAPGAGPGCAQSRDLARRCSVVKPPQSVCTM